MVINKKLDHKLIWKNTIKGYSTAIIAFIIMSLLPMLFTVNKNTMYNDSSIFAITWSLVLALTPFAMGVLVGHKMKFNIFESIALGIASIIVSRSMLAPTFVVATGKIDFTSMAFKLMPLISNDAFSIPNAVGNYFSSLITVALFTYLLSFIRMNGKYDYLYMPILGMIVGIIALPVVSVLAGLFLAFFQWVASLTIKSDVYAMKVGLSTLFALILSIFMLSPVTGILFLMPWISSGTFTSSQVLMIAGITSSFSIMFGYLSFRATKKWSSLAQVVLISPLLLMDKIIKKPVLIIIPVVLATIFAPITIAVFEIAAFKTYMSKFVLNTNIETSVLGTTFLIPQLKLIFGNTGKWALTGILVGHIALIQIGLPAIFIWLSTRSQFTENEWTSEMLSVEPYNDENATLEGEALSIKKAFSTLKEKISERKQSKELMKKTKEEEKEDE